VTEFVENLPPMGSRSTAASLSSRRRFSATSPMMALSGNMNLCDSLRLTVSSVLTIMSGSGSPWIRFVTVSTSSSCGPRVTPLGGKVRDDATPRAEAGRSSSSRALQTSCQPRSERVPKAHWAEGRRSRRHRPVLARQEPRPRSIAVRIVSSPSIISSRRRENGSAGQNDPCLRRLDPHAGACSRLTRLSSAERVCLISRGR
jgi:hypothetical protein